MQAQDLPELKTKIAARVHGSPQSLRLLALAIAELRGGMEKLGSMGYPVYLSETPIEEGIAPWPRIYFHQTSAPNGRMVLGERELEELGSGWFDNAQAAAHWDGMETQFAGRGGVPRTGALRLISDQVSDFFEPPEEVKKRIIAEFLAQRDKVDEN